MALRNIVTEKEPRLRKTSRPVEQFDERLWTLLDDMAETMYAADGVGIAGVQGKLPVKLTEDEMQKLHASADKLKETIGQIYFEA